MHTSEMHRSTVGVQASPAPVVEVDGPATALREGRGRARRTLVRGAAATLAVGALAAGAAVLAAGSGSGTEDRSGAAPVVATSCYLPKGGEDTAQAPAIGTAAAASTPAPHVPALYGLEQVAAHTICR